MPDARPAVSVITGATSGIGRAAVFALAERGFNLVLLGRNQQRGEALVRRLSRQYAPGRFAFVRCDLSSLTSVCETAATIRTRHRCIDVLINNAGARFDTYQESLDGFELTFATNHLGHFLLNGLIMDLLLAAPVGRILTVSSRRHSCVKSVDEWMASPKNYDRWSAYDRSKLANTLFGFELARRVAGTTALSNVIDPGIVASNFARNNGIIAWIKHIVSSLMHRQLVSCSHAAEAIVYAAAPETAGWSGRYFSEKEEVTPSDLALDAGLAARLWKSSSEWTGLNANNCRVWNIIARE